MDKEIQYRKELDMITKVLYGIDNGKQYSKTGCIIDENTESITIMIPEIRTDNSDTLCPEEEFIIYKSRIIHQEIIGLFKECAKSQWTNCSIKGIDYF